MPKELFISVAPAEIRSALVEDGAVVDVSLDRHGDASVVGNVYLGRVERVMHAMGAAFVDIGLERSGFLVLDEGRDGGGTPLHEGEAVLAVAVKDPAGRKGAQLSRRLSLPARHLVYLPGGGGVSVSRRISDGAERERLTGLVDGVRGPGEGIVLRTAAAGASREDLESDVRELRAAWEAVRAAAETARAPACLRSENDPLARILRDHAPDGVDRVIVDAEDAADAVRRHRAAGDMRERVEVRASGGDLFESAGLAEQIKATCERRVGLPSGAGLVIESTEALTAIDVNSGSSGNGRDPGRSAFEINREAAAEAFRQIRLRNLSGLIVIDFIGMEKTDHWNEVVGVLETAAARDRNQARVLGRTKSGLVELVRRRRRRTLSQLMTRPCPACRGSGRTMSADAAGAEVLRALRYGTLPAGGVRVHVAPEVAAVLGGRYADAVRGLAVGLARRIEIHAEKGFETHRYEFASG